MKNYRGRKKAGTACAKVMEHVGYNELSWSTRAAFSVADMQMVLYIWCWEGLGKNSPILRNQILLNVEC